MELDNAPPPVGKRGEFGPGAMTFDWREKVLPSAGERGTLHTQ
jgi:hypothetical protein